MADMSPVAAGSAAAATAAVHLEPHADAEDMCTPKYFVFNSQVRRLRRRSRGSSYKVKRSRFTEASQRRGDTLCIYDTSINVIIGAKLFALLSLLTTS